MKKGSLICVGTGLHLGQATVEAQQAIEEADQVLYIVPETDTVAWIKKLNPNAETLSRYYEKGKLRRETYDLMTEAILSPVREGKKVCAVFYGHPGLFVNASHAAIRIAREEGYEAYMQPGVSAEDCLFADLGVDPCRDGCQSYEATDFLICHRVFDVRTMLVLWQVAVVAVKDYQYPHSPNYGFPYLVDYLTAFYGPEHVVSVYDKSFFPGEPPKIQRIALRELNKSHISAMSTLFVPPLSEPEVDEELRARLKAGERFQPIPA